MSRTDPVRVLVVEHEAGAPAALLGQWLQQAGADLDVRRPYAGDDLPDTLDDHDALLVLGGSMGAHDDADHWWLEPTKALVRRAAEERVTTLGVCLGHQLAAVALGGRSARNPAGQQLGLLPVGWTWAVHDDPLFAAAPGAAGRGLHWNDDVVVEQPPGTVVLALAPGGELQVARYAPTVWGVQLHPEVDEAIVRGWHEEDPDRHAEGVVGPVLAAVTEARDELERSWRPLAEQLVALARQPREAYP
ncbi:type 1 glutamine amidotransferase [Nocardioides aequoreus]|uniref:type 1 glutamine amidotransferase n=1 Tax=Nocardioides aequoreus TaxID=397278 RepID=UPI0009FEF404|nr:type 1 glutamine amidotransferase [Nocardioides aequoreus]